VNAYENYLALDLELNNAPDGSTPTPKIIQVGIAIGSWDHFQGNQIITRKWYFDPQEPIYPFITELTGITDDDIKQNAVTHEVFAEEFAEFIKPYKPYVNFITWGGGDVTELKDELTVHGVHFPFGGRRWIDVKTWYTLHMLAKSKRPTGGLKSAMAEYKLQFQGTPHRADDDALNTLRLFFTILDKQSKMYQLINWTKEL
jgi:inhibitor of KinA sporulation pathway (predicted exonuclease)